jgi:hypothetical protein
MSFPINNNKMDNKPEFIIEKLEFPVEDKEYIDAMIEGTPTPREIKMWESKGYDIKYKMKHYTPPKLKERIRKLSSEYGVGNCAKCRGFPSVKLIWKLDGASRVEYHCNSCHDKQGRY